MPTKFLPQYPDFEKEAIRSRDIYRMVVPVANAVEVLLFTARRAMLGSLACPGAVLHSRCW